MTGLNECLPEHASDPSVLAPAQRILAIYPVGANGKAVHAKRTACWTEKDAVERSGARETVAIICESLSRVI